MAAQRGKDLLVKLDMTGAGVFETVAGLRASRITFNAETVDVTNLGSAGRWRELLSGAGVRSAAITGSGVFRDEATVLALYRERLPAYALADLKVDVAPGEAAEEVAARIALLVAERTCST